MRRVPGSDRLVLALDLDDLGAARGLTRRLAPYFTVAKVGLELFAAAGPAALEALSAEGFELFADLKLHDIPTTVGRAARLLARGGVRYLTVHTSGGRPMLEAAAAGCIEGAAQAGIAPPVLLGVTVLTSDPEASAALLARRAGLARESGCGGVVCAAADLPVVAEAAPGLLRVVPGIRPEAAPRDDQARAGTPLEAVRDGADLLVVGRAVTAADDPAAAAAAIAASVASSVEPVGGGERRTRPRRQGETRR